MNEISVSTSPTRRAARSRWPGWARRVRYLPIVVILGALGYRRMTAPLEVRAAVVERADVVQEVFGRGTIESQRSAELGFDLVGRLSDVLVDEGARVMLGQALARLYPDQVAADLHAASSGVSAAKTSLEALAADERRARAVLDGVERDEQRTSYLFSSGAVARDLLDAARDHVLVARAELDRILARRSEASRSIEVASGGVEQRRATVLRATLLAPFNGLITRRLHDPGDTVAVGSTVLRLVDTEHVYVAAWIDESALAQVREGLSVRVEFPGDRVSRLAHVSRVGWEADRQTHELTVDVTPDAPLARVAIGQRADVRIEVARKSKVLSVPLAFLRRTAEGDFCVVDRDSRTLSVRVKTGLWGRDTVEILEGLNERDTVLMSPSPLLTLPDGRRWVRQ